MKNRMLAILLCLCLLLSALPCAAAEDVGDPEPCNNLRVSLRDTSFLTAREGGYLRIFVRDGTLHIEELDDDFALTGRRELALELPVWGGFFAGADGYYVATGQNNLAEDDEAEVFRITRYDREWNRVGAACITGNPSLFGGEVRYPFDYGCAEFCERDGILYLVTGHEGYVDERYGQGHQGFVMLRVDEAAMTGEIVSCDLWHSFAQRIRAQGDSLYVLQQSEGSRCTTLGRWSPEGRKLSNFSILDYGGSRDSAWAISCFASVDDMAVMPDAVLTVGTSIDQSHFDDMADDEPHNIYLTRTPLDDLTADATEVKWLTHYEGDNASFFGVKLTKISDERLLLMWEETAEPGEAEPGDSLSAATLHYLFLDAAGDPVSEEFTARAPISDCHPIVKDGKVVYSASCANQVNFYRIDAATGAFDKTCHRVLGAHIAWSVEDGMLTVSGTGTLPAAGSRTYRYPLSSTASYYSSYSYDWLGITDQTKKAVVSGGVENVPDGFFRNFTQLTEIEFQRGVKTIGDRLVSSSVSKVTLPASVTQIAEDAFWAGYYWVGSGGKAYQVRICAPAGSYALEYAEALGIYAEVLPCDHDWSEWQPAASAGCTQPGEATRTCALCHETETRTIDAPGHDWDTGTVTTPATCTAPGVRTVTCTRCGETRTEAIDALPHTPRSVPGTPADCTHEGRTDGSVCAVCGAVLTESETIPALGHLWSDDVVSTPPTCAHEGEATGTCTRCGLTQSHPVPTLPHTLQTISGTPAACEAPGLTDGAVCTVCAQVVTAQEVIPPTGHLWDPGVVTIAPTAFTPGEKVFTCTVCGAEQKTELAPLGSQFVDVPEDQYFYAPVLWAAANGITTGITPTEFRPARTCTRAQVVTFLWRAAGEPAPANAGQSPFVDVDPAGYYAAAVAWAVEHGITTGVDPTHFRPDAIVTRAQFVTFLHRYHSTPEFAEVTAFTDVAEGDFFYSAVQWAAETGITTGITPTEFRPLSPCTRAQVVTFLYRDLAQ